MSRIMEWCEGVVCYANDIVVHGKEMQEHNTGLHLMLKALKEAGLTLNEKCEFAKDSFMFVDQRISSDCVTPDPDKVKAIMEMPDPTGVKDGRRVMEMASYLGKFRLHLASYTCLIKDLFSEKRRGAGVSLRKKPFRC